MVLAKKYDYMKEETYIRLVREYIGKTIQRSGKNYKITVSIGCYRAVPDPNGAASIQSEAELYLGNADRAMYEEKEEYNR